MNEVLEKAGSQADMILVDSPPVVPVPDGAVIANKVDGVVLVVASHETDKRLVLKSRESLKRARANILGVVLNKYPADKDRNYYNFGISAALIYIKKTELEEMLFSRLIKKFK